MILAYCDFKTVLTLNYTSKKFIRLCLKEQRRRVRIYSSNPTKFENPNSRFYGVKCDGILVQLEYFIENRSVSIKQQQIRLDCKKYGYVAGFKNGYCKSCNDKKLEIDCEQRILRDSYEEGCVYSNARYSKLSQVERLKERRAEDDREEAVRKAAINNSKPTKFIGK